MLDCCKKNKWFYFGLTIPSMLLYVLALAGPLLLMFEVGESAAHFVFSFFGGAIFGPDIGKRFERLAVRLLIPV